LRVPPLVAADGLQGCAGSAAFGVDAQLQLAGVLIAGGLCVVLGLLACARHPLGHQASGRQRDARGRLKGLVDAIGFISHQLLTLPLIVRLCAGAARSAARVLLVLRAVRSVREPVSRARAVQAVPDGRREPPPSLRRQPRRPRPARRRALGSRRCPC